MPEFIDGDGPFYQPSDCQPFEIGDYGSPERADMLPKTISIVGADGTEIWFERKSTVSALLKQLSRK